MACALTWSGVVPNPGMVQGASKPGDVSIARYTEVLRETRDLLYRAGTPGTTAVSVAIRASALLRSVNGVMMVGGAHVVPDNSAILADLAARPPRIAAGRARVDRLLAELGRVSPAMTSPRSDALLSAVFNRPPFADNANASPWDTIGQHIHNWLMGLLPGLRSGGASDTLWQFIEGLLILVAAAGVAIIVLVAGRGFLETLAPSPVSPSDPLSTEAGLDSAGARGRAGESATRAEYRAAVRYLFLAMILDLDGHDIVRFDPAAADRDLVGQARRQDQAVGDLLAQGARMFQSVWYGHQPCTAGDYAALMSVADRLAQATETLSRRRRAGDEG